MRSPRVRPAAALALGAAVFALGLGPQEGCADGPAPGAGGGAIPAATPPPAVAPAGAGQNLDEWLAYVEGEYITRRTVVRQIGPKDPEEDDSLYEERVHSRVLKMAMNRVLVKAAQRATLDIRPDMVDKELEKAAKAEVEQAKKRAEAARPGSGAGITFEKLLKERGQTIDEFREELARSILVEQYFYLLWHGVPGKRPVFDPEPAPDDARRLYAKHRESFDVKSGVKFGLFTMQPVDLIEDGKRTYDEAVEEARRRMAALLAAHVGGAPAEEVAARYGLGSRKAWRSSEDWDTKAPQKGDRPTEEWVDWVFDPNRRPGETKVVEARGGMIVGLAVRERRAARPKTFEEVLPDLLGLIKRIRLAKFQLQTRRQLLAAASIHPLGIADALEQSIQLELARIEEDPVLRDIRMR